jgi:hypothetical protein
MYVGIKIFLPFGMMIVVLGLYDATPQTPTFVVYETHTLLCSYHDLLGGYHEEIVLCHETG